MNELTKVLAQAMAEYAVRRDDILETFVQLRTNRLVEECRRRMEGLTLKSTYNADRIRTLEKLVADLRSELAPLVQAMVVKRTILAFAEQELEDYRRADEALRQERAVHEATGMYAEPTRFVDLLYREHEIDRGDFAALTEGDVAAIAAIIDKRAAPLRTKEARAATVARTRTL